MTERLLYANARVVDGRGLISERANVLVEGTTIKDVDAADDLPGSQVIDMAGRTLCPGLMNAHVHLGFDSSVDPQAQFLADTDVESALHALPRLTGILKEGVTTVRDLGGKPDVTISLGRAVEAGLIPGPRILAAGSVICVPGGHGHWMGIEVEGASEARRATQAMIEAGAHVIKLMATAGMMTSGQEAGEPQLSVAEMSAAVEEAHAFGKHVAAHVESRQGAINALDAGVDSIEHGHGLDVALLEQMKESGVALVPTISCDRIITSRGLQSGIPPFIVEDCARLAPSLERALEQAIDLGVTIAAGNDGGAPLTSSGAIVDELEIYVEMGMSAREAVVTATTNTASLFGLDDVGLIEPGHQADLLVINGDPTENIGTLRSPDMVMTRGWVFDVSAGPGTRRTHS